jgi:hypothetical protein
MKILYLTEVNIDRPSNLLNKMNAQIDEWVGFGHEVYVASFPLLNIQGKSSFLTNKVAGQYFHKNFFAEKFLKGGVFMVGNKIMCIKNYSDYIHSIAPDLIYLREMVGFPGMATLLKKQKVVMESNTLLMDEISLNSKKLYQLAKLYQEKVNRQIDGFIGVTGEIGRQFEKYGKPIKTITNGIKFPEEETTTTVNNRAQIIMVCTPDMPWHGEDKFIKMARLLSQFDFHIVGPVKPILQTDIKNIFFHGYQTGIELGNLYRRMDIGVGTLALHRKNMAEACPLKVREYAIFGLPMILGYHDTDLSDKNFEFILQIENEENNIENNIENIRDFILNWKANRIPAGILKPLISISEKEKLRLEFFKQIAFNQ